jgi:sugar (pentulose or hexulose) kinase
MYNPKTGTWAEELLDKLDINKNILTDIINPGSIMGTLRKEICEELGINEIPVIAVASHDTASAVASVPAVDEKDYIYISSGTWSLMGVESDEPIINDKSLEYNYTNEIGYNNKVITNH